jgi:transposase
MDLDSPVPDDLWALVAPLLPPRPPRPKGGRPRLSDRRALCGIGCVLKTGIGWNALPPALGRGSGTTCWRRLRAWQLAGVWQAPHRAILDRPGAAGGIDP